MPLRACVALLAVVTAMTTSGCVFYPAKVEVYEPACQVMLERYELRAEELYLDSRGGCSGHEAECLGFLVAFSAGSAIVSGSIVVVGNTWYWLERHGSCPVRRRRHRPTEDPDALA